MKQQGQVYDSVSQDRNVNDTTERVVDKDRHKRLYRIEQEQGGGARSGAFEVCRLADVSDDPVLSAELVTWYMSVFNATGEGEWAEDWTQEKAKRQLFEDARSETEHSFVTMWRPKEKLLGASLVYVDASVERLSSRDLPPAFKDNETLAAVKQQLAWLVGDHSRIMVFREIGIIKEGRGGLEPVMQLIREPLLVSHEHGARHGCFWTSKKSRMYPLMIGFGLRTVYEFGDPDQHVFMVDSVEHVLRRLRCSSSSARTIIAERVRQRIAASNN